MGDFYRNAHELRDFWEMDGAKKIESNSRLVNVTRRLMNDGYLNQLDMKAPQIVVKIVSHALGARQMEKMINYLGREGSLGFETESRDSVKDKSEVKELVSEWRKDFLSKDAYGKSRGVKDVTHMVLSVGGPADLDRASQATRSFLVENFGAGGYKYVFVAHTDTRHLHFHVAVHNQSLFGNRLYFDKADLFTLRSEYARHLSALGIERVATFRKDRVEILEKMQAGKEGIKENSSWYQNKLNESDKKVIKKDIQKFMKKYRKDLKEMRQFITDYNKVSSPNDRQRMSSSLKKINELLKASKSKTLGF